MADQHGSLGPGKNARSDQARDISPLSSDACLLRHVARVSRAVVAAYDPAFAEYGLTGHQFNLLMTLSQLGPMTVGALAEALGMDASGVPRAIRPLTESGVIDVKRGADRRQRMLNVTPKGRDLLDKAGKAWRRVQTELVDQIGASRWSSLMSELRIVRKAAQECSTRRSAA